MNPRTQSRGASSAVWVFLTLWAVGGTAVPCSAQQATSPADQAERLIAEAARTSDPNARNALLDSAAEALGRQASELDKPGATPEQLLTVLRLKLRAAEVIGLLQAEPHFLRLRYLQGGPDDRAALSASAGAAWTLLEDLTQRIGRTLAEWRGDYKKLVTVVPELEDLRKSVRRSAGWVALYRAMGSGDQQERQRMLEGAMSLAGACIQEGADGSAVASLLLLRGMARREAGQFDAASADLLASADPNTDPRLRADAVFELARNLIEQGKALSATAGASADDLAQAERKFDQADKAIDAFAQLVHPQAPQEGLEADAKRTLLVKRLCDVRASCRRDAPAAAADRRRANEEVLSFLSRHTDIQVQRAFLAIIVGDSPGPRDYQGVDSVLLLALGAAGADGTLADGWDRRRELLEMIRGRSDPLSLRVGPLATWHLAFLAADRGDHAQAGRLFGELASQSSLGPLAAQATVNAAVSFSRAVASLAEGKRPVPPELRRQLIGALESLLQRDEGKAQGEKWRFELGWQYEKLSEQADPNERPGLAARAIAAYDAVPADAERHFQARYRALELRYRQMQPPSVDPAWRQRAAVLAGKLKAFAADLAARRQPATVPAGELGSWGARAEFRAAELLYELPDKREEAMSILRDLPNRWPETDVLAEGAEFEIHKLLEQGRIDQAAGRVEAFSRDHPEQGRRLIQLVVAQIRRQIDSQGVRDEGRGSQAGDIKRDFLRLAGLLYEPLAGQPVEQRCDVTEMYAEALVANGRADEAMPLLLQCAKFLEATGHSDAANIAALARAYRLLGKHAEAVRYYRELVDGLAGGSAAYWNAELEYCQCLLEGFAADGVAMKGLLVRLKQLRMEDPGMGGLKDRFEAIESRASELAG